MISKRQMDGRWRESGDPTYEEMRANMAAQDAKEREKRKPIPEDSDQDIWDKHPTLKEAVIAVVLRHPERIPEVQLDYIRAQGHRPTEATFYGVRRDALNVLRAMKKFGLESCSPETNRKSS